MQQTELPPFGETLKRARVAAGLTQEELAERTGISVRTLRYLEQEQEQAFEEAIRGKQLEEQDQQN